MFFKYLKHNLKSTFLRTLVFILIATSFMLITLPGLISPYVRTQEKDGKVIKEVIIYDTCESGMDELSTLLIVVSVLMPILNLSELKKRRNLDTLLSFPLSRAKLSLVHFISGFIQSLLVYSCTFFVSYIFLVFNTEIFDLKYMLLFYPVSIVASFFVYSFVAFLYSNGNTILDGIIILFLWFRNISLSFYHILSENFLEKINGYHWTSIFSLINNSVDLFIEKCEVNRKFSDYNEGIYNSWYMFLFWALIGIMCFVGYVLLYSKYRADKAEEISDSWFGYKTLIPVSGPLFAWESFDGFSIEPIILMYIMYIVYRRSFKLKKRDYIVLAATVLLIFLFFYKYHYVWTISK